MALIACLLGGARPGGRNLSVRFVNLGYLTEISPIYYQNLKFVNLLTWMLLYRKK